MVVMHVCDTPACYRYDHLRLGTQLDNIADMTAKGRAVGGGGRYRGEQVKNAALTDEQAQQLRDVYNGSRMSIADVAAQYGVSKSTAHRIIRHERYA
jgi:Spy/CpxP family protein refolding chaperone